MEIESNLTKEQMDYERSYRRKSRNKYLIETEYDTLTRKQANDILNNIVKSRKKEKEALLKLPENIQNKFR